MVLMGHGFQLAKWKQEVWCLRPFSQRKKNDDLFPSIEQLRPGWGWVGSQRGWASMGLGFNGIGFQRWFQWRWNSTGLEVNGV